LSGLVKGKDGDKKKKKYSGSLLAYLPLAIDSTTSFNFAATNSGSFTRGRQNSSHLAAQLTCTREANETAVLYIHALLIRLFSSFFPFASTWASIYFFPLY